LNTWKNLGRDWAPSWNRQREFLKTVLLLLAVILLVFYPVLFQGKLLLPTDMIDSMTLPYSVQYAPPHASNPYVADGLLQFYPYKLMLRDAWLHGRFTFWNPYNLCGYPQYAETMGTNFDVLNLILLLVPLPLGFNIYLLFPLLLAGVGMYYFLRNYGIRIWIARLFATSYMLNGLFISHLEPHFIPGSFCWAPFLCLYLKKFFDSGRTSQLVYGAIALGLGFLGGNLQTSGFLVLLAILYVFLYSTPFRIKRKIESLVTLFAIALCLTAFMWVPTLEMFWQVSKYGTVSSSSLTQEYSFIHRFLSIPMLLTFFIPPLAGPINGVKLYNAIGLFTIDFNAVISYIPLLLGLWATIRRWRDPSIRPFLLLVVFGFALPIATPLYHYLYHRFFIVGIFGLIVAGAVALEQILESESVRRSIHGWILKSFWIFASVAILIVAFGILISVRYETLYSFLDRYLGDSLHRAAFAAGNPSWIQDRITATLNNYSISSLPMLLWIVSIVVGYYLLLKLVRDHAINVDRVLIGLWLISAIQLGLNAYTWLPHVDSGRYPLLPQTELTKFLRSDTSSRIFVDRRFHPNERYLFLDNENTAYHIADISAFESLLPRSFYLKVRELVTDSSAPSPLLALLDVKYIVTGQSAHLPREAFRLVDSQGFKLWENHTVARRSWLSFSTIESPNDSVSLQQLENPSFNPTRVIIAQADGAMSLKAPVDSSSKTLLVTNDPEKIVLNSSSKSPAYLVLSDTYYPGWEATVDGKDVPIYRANYAMRAVFLEPGTHTVTYEFRPLSFRIGLWISLLTLAGVCFYVIITATRARNKKSMNFETTLD
jgi:hypothetical protein